MLTTYLKQLFTAEARALGILIENLNFLYFVQGGWSVSALNTAAIEPRYLVVKNYFAAESSCPTSVEHVSFELRHVHQLGHLQSIRLVLLTKSSR